MTYCTGIPGESAHKVSNPDDLVGGICDSCQVKLTSATSWSNQLRGINEAKSRGGKKSGGNVQFTATPNNARFPAK